MTNSMRVWTTGELYPPPQDETQRKLLEEIFCGGQDGGGRKYLRRALSMAEHTTLVGRRDVIAKWLSKPRYSEVQTIILALLTKAGSEATARQYAYALGDLPLWVIKRTCDRFAAGTVTPQDLGIEAEKITVPPSCAQIHTVARALCRPLADEYRRICAALAGIEKRPEETPEEHAAASAAVKKSLQDQRARFAAANIAEAEEDAMRQERKKARAEAVNLQQRQDQYRGAGLDVPEGTDFPSLSMMLQQGYTIQEVARGQFVLIAPPPQPPRALSEKRPS